MSQLNLLGAIPTSLAVSEIVNEGARIGVQTNLPPCSNSCIFQGLVTQIIADQAITAYTSQLWTKGLMYDITPTAAVPATQMASALEREAVNMKYRVRTMLHAQAELRVRLLKSLMMLKLPPYSSRPHLHLSIPKIKPMNDPRPFLTVKAIMPSHGKDWSHVTGINSCSDLHLTPQIVPAAVIPTADPIMNQPQNEKQITPSAAAAAAAAAAAVVAAKRAAATVTVERSRSPTPPPTALTRNTSQQGIYVPRQETEVNRENYVTTAGRRSPQRPATSSRQRPRPYHARPRRRRFRPRQVQEEEEDKEAEKYKKDQIAQIQAQLRNIRELEERAQQLREARNSIF